jgi:hypothetical protein
MTLRPGAILGLPEGVPDAVFDVVALRYLLVALAAGWAAAALRERRRMMLAAGLAFATAAVGFWVLALGRPYGLFVDGPITRSAAEASVVASSGSRAETFLAGEAAPATPAVVLAGMGVPAPLLIVGPTFLPVVLLAAVALFIYVACPDRRQAPVAASLWLAFSTGDLETLRGMGIVPGLWSHPWPAVAALALLLLSCVAPVSALVRGLTVFGAGLFLLRAPFVGAVGPGLGLAQSVLLLTLDQVPWLALAAWGVWRGSWAASRVLIAAGASLVMASAVGPVDAWAAHLLYRAGLILAAAGPVEVLAERAGLALLAARPSLSRHADARGWGLAAMIAAFVPGSFLAWWNPARLDPVADASVYPHSSRIAAVADWIRQGTPRGAAFLAPPEYGPDIAVLAGRRVLRAPALGEAADEVRRQRVERLVLAGRPPEGPLRFYNLRYVFLAPGGFPDHGIHGPEDLEARPGFVLRHAADEFRIYEITQ